MGKKKNAVCLNACLDNPVLCITSETRIGKVENTGSNIIVNSILLLG